MLCIILVYVVGNVMALSKLLGVANVWQAPRNFRKMYFGVYLKNKRLFQSMLSYSLAARWKISEEVYSIISNVLYMFFDSAEKNCSDVSPIYITWSAIFTKNLVNHIILFVLYWYLFSKAVIILLVGNSIKKK